MWCQMRTLEMSVSLQYRPYLLQVSWQPAVYVRDTPGVLAPRIPGIEAGLKLALAATVQEHLISKQYMADYLLFWWVNESLDSLLKYY